MSNYIANSTAANTYFTSAGVAIGSTTQPRINQSVIAGVLDTSLDAADVGLVSTYNQTVYTGFDDVSVIRGLSNSLRGSANTSIRSPSSDYHRESIAQLDAVRTVKTATAIRAGFWNEHSGGWSTPPSTANDLSAFGNDDEADSNRANPGTFVWAYAGSGIAEAYPARTQ